MFQQFDNYTHAHTHKLTAKIAVQICKWLRKTAKKCSQSHYIGNGVMLPETPGVCALIPS